MSAAYLQLFRGADKNVVSRVPVPLEEPKYSCDLCGQTATSPLTAPAEDWAGLLHRGPEFSICLSSTAPTGCAAMGL